MDLGSLELKFVFLGASAGSKSDNLSVSHKKGRKKEIKIENYIGFTNLQVGFFEIC